MSGGVLLGTFSFFSHENVHFRSSLCGGAYRTYRDQGGDTQDGPSLRFLLLRADGAHQWLRGNDARVNVRSSTKNRSLAVR